MAFALATFNVKDLLEPHDERSRTVIGRKVEAIAALLRECDADVVGLQEVGTMDLAREVVARLPGCGYGEPVLGTADARGIRCALLTRLPMLSAHVWTAERLPFPVFRTGDPPPFGARLPLRRGVVHVRVSAPEIGEVDVLVVHFKSAHSTPLRDASGVEVQPRTALDRAEGSVRSTVWRTAEALHARGQVDEILAADTAARIAVVGDLNDEPSSPTVRALKSEGKGELFDCATIVDPAARFSVLHEGKPIQIDHVLVTANLYARLVGARFVNAALRDHGPFDRAMQAPPTVDSDHAPLLVRFA